MKKYALIPILCFFAVTTAFGSQIFKFSDLKMLSQSTTAQGVFDQAINLAPNFVINQLDSDLKDLFTKDGISNICVPTTLANFIVYQMAIQKTVPITTDVPGVSNDLASIDVSPLIHDLAIRCKTPLAGGTEDRNFMACIKSAYSAYFHRSVSIERIQAESPNYFDSSIQWSNRVPDLTDISQAIQKNEPVLASVYFWNLSMKPGYPDWSSADLGHEFMIYGYQTEKYWNDNLMDLIITNPESISTPGYVITDWHPVMALRRYPDSNDPAIFLDGIGFSGQDSRAELDSLTIIHSN